MYRTGKPFYGSAKLFVLFLLCIYVIATKFTFEVEGASPTGREIEEAQKIVGRFLRNEVGSKWLSGLVRTNSAPLTAEDLTNAILNTTKPEETVWQAASILREALKSQTSRGIKSDAIMDQISNWKDLIADIEKEDDIICLYRKNTQQTAKKAEDWRKFLKTVTPGYTVHLAIDTGLKYVICLKKIEVSEVSSTETLKSSVTLSTPVASTILQEIPMRKQLLQAAAPEKLKTITSIAMRKDKNNTKLDINLKESKESCEGSEVEKTKDKKLEDINGSKEFLENNLQDDDNDDGFLNHSSEDKDFKQKSLFQMEDLTAGLETYPLKFGTAEEKMIKPMNRRNNFPFEKRRNRLNNLSLDTQRRSLSDYPPKMVECNGPIIVVMMPDARLPVEYQPQYQLQLPAQRSFVPFRLPSIPRISIPRPPKIPWPPFNLPAPVNKYPQFPKLPNVGLPIRGYSTFIYKGGPQKMLSTTTHFTYTIPQEKVKTKPTGIEAIIQTAQNALVPDKKNLDDRFIQQGPNSKRPDKKVLQGYPVVGSLPKRVNRLSVPNVSDTMTSITGSSGMSGWKQMKETRKSDPNIRHTEIPIHGTPGMIEWNRKSGTRNLVPNFHRTAIPIDGSPEMGQWIQMKRARSPGLNIPNTDYFRALSRLTQSNEKIPTGKYLPMVRNVAIPIKERPQILSWADHIKPTKNSLVHKDRISDQSQFTKNKFPSNSEQERMKYLNRQSMINRIRSTLASKRPIPRSTVPFIQTDLSPSKQQSIIQSQPLMSDRSGRGNSNMNQRFPLGLQLSSNQKIDQFESQLRNKLRSDRMPFHIHSTNPRANFPSVNNFLRMQQKQSAFLKPLIRNPASLPGNIFYPPRNDGPCMRNLNENPHYHRTFCASSCDKPIKLQIVVQGKAEEPLKFSVLTEPNQRLEIVNSDKPMPHGSRAANRETFMGSILKKSEKEKPFEVAEIAKRFYDLEEGTGKIEKANSVMNSTSDKIKELVNEESSMEKLSTERMTTEEVTEITTMQEIRERILLDITTPPPSRFNESTTNLTIKNSTVIADLAPMSTTTNSTIMA